MVSASLITTPRRSSRQTLTLTDDFIRRRNLYATRCPIGPQGDLVRSAARHPTNSRRHKRDYSRCPPVKIRKPHLAPPVPGTRNSRRMFQGYDASRPLKSPLVQQKVPVLQSLAKPSARVSKMPYNPCRLPGLATFFLQFLRSVSLLTTSNGYYVRRPVSLFREMAI